MNCITIKAYYIILFLVCLILSACRQSPVIPQKDQTQGDPKKLIEMNRALIRKDRLRIEGYISRNQLDMQETGTGLWYSITDKGDGALAKKGNLINIAYALSLLDGKECYNSKKDGIKTFVSGQGGIESGLEEGVLLMHVGDKARFIMPPHLAHGLTGDGNKIPARAIIIYDVELLSIQQ